MGRRRADDAVVALLRTCRSIATSRSRANGPHSRCLSSTTIGATPLRPNRRREQRHVSWTCSRRTYAVPSEGSRIAITGGGLTGLTTAYYLAKQLPSSAKITLYEGSDRLGGWVRTDRVPVNVGGVRGTVSFERGPRTLSSLKGSTWRFDDLVLYDLALDLGLKISTPPDRPRYVYYPDHLVPLPPASSFAEFIREPLFLESFWAGFGFLLRRLRNRDMPKRDLSLGEWLYEISGSRSVADNIASAMIHGIYGGDIYQLSARSVFDRFYWGYYLPNLGPSIRHMPAREVDLLMSPLGKDPQIRKLALRPKGSLLHFGKAGMESLPTALADALKGQSNVEIKLGEPVSRIAYNQEAQKVEITTESNKSQGPEVFDKVISTIPSQHLSRLTGDKLPALAFTQSASIMTVNIWYPQTNIKPPGFGYLIPRSVSPKHNPERALGVFFDSDVGVSGHGEPAGTKLFVLMGGHYYDVDPSGRTPSEDQAIDQAKNLLERHLGIPRSTPCFAMARLAKECIPQHHVGHYNRMVETDKQLRDAFGGRLAVAGGSFSNIGAMGAIRSGYEIARQISSDDKEAWLATGLEHMQFPEKFVSMPLEEISVRGFK